MLGSRGSADTVRDTRGFATKFYTDEGTFDLVGNNIPVFFIQDGIKFPDVIHAGKPHPDREIPQAQSAHDTFWDFVSLHTEATAPHDVEHVRPRHPALVPDDGGLRGPHLPAGQRRRRDVAGEVPLEAGRWACTPWSGRRRRCRRRRPGLPPPRPGRRDRGRRLPAVGARHPGLPGHRRADLRGHRPARPDQARARGARAGAADRPADAERATRRTTSPRPSRSPSTSATWCRASTSPTTRCCRRGCSPTSTPSSPGSAGPNFTQLPINRPHAPVNDMLRDGMHQNAVHAGVAPYRPNSLDGGGPFTAGPQEGGYVEVPQPRGGRPGPCGAGLVRRPLQPGAHVLAQHERGRAGPHRRGLHLRAGQVLRAGDQGAPAAGPGQHRRQPVRAGRRRSRSACAEGQAR